MLIAVYEKNSFVIFKIIFGTLWFLNDTWPWLDDTLVQNLTRSRSNLIVKVAGRSSRSLITHELAHFTFGPYTLTLCLFGRRYRQKSALSNWVQREYNGFLLSFFLSSAQPNWTRPWQTSCHHGVSFVILTTTTMLTEPGESLSCFVGSQATIISCLEMSCCLQCHAIICARRLSAVPRQSTHGSSYYLTILTRPNHKRR